MDWTKILALIFGSSLISTVITNLWSHRRDRKEEKRYNSYTALIVAHLLEDYAHECAMIKWEHETIDQSRGAAGALAHLPENPFLIPEHDFKRFDQALLDRTLSFQKLIRTAEKHLRFERSILSDLEVAETAYNSMIDLGIEALELSLSIRKKYHRSRRLSAKSDDLLNEFRDRKAAT